MPIHLEDLDVVSEVSGLNSALIVPCNMCAGATLAARRDKPFIQLFKSFLRSAPLEQHVDALRSQLIDNGVDAEVFDSRLPHHYFLCMWTSGRRQKLQERAKQFEAAIVLGCDSATETVRDAATSTGCKVIPGMEVAGVMNAKLRFRLPCDISFEDCKTVPLQQKN